MTSKRAADGDAESEELQSSNKKIKMETRECSICCRDVALNQFPRHPHHGLPHKREGCKKCWQDHVAAEVSSKAWDAVVCLQCPGVLEHDEIKERANKKTYNRWLDKAAKACNEQDEEWRACPRAECDFGCIFTSANGNILTCGKCRYRHCVVCEEAMHDGQTCDQYQEATRQEGKAGKGGSEVRSNHEQDLETVPEVWKASSQDQRVRPHYL